MNPNVKALKIPLLVILCLSSILLFHNPISHSVSADVYTSDKISSGGSNYTLYLDLSTTSWTRGTLIYFDVGLTVNSFGPGVVDFHGIELWLKFDNGSGYEVTDSSTGGIIDTVGNSFEDSWYLTPSIAMADSFTIYIGSKFLED
ncbi:MAG: hypothetical protein GPJ51_02685, partial [Candidatus Heimdallarchaeota archaeon]|nr:hypothetical protein [Candidatus Heimdallarchaeota archaeon]